MTPTPPPPLDIVTVAVAVATALFGSQVAALVGPYAVILLGALGGAGWSALNRQESGNWRTAAYMALRVLLALMVAVPLAELVVWAAASFGWSADSRWMLGPVAAVIAGVGPEWFIVQLRRLAELRLGLRREDTPQ